MHVACWPGCGRAATVVSIGGGSAAEQDGGRGGEGEGGGGERDGGQVGADPGGDLCGERGDAAVGGPVGA